MSEQQFDARLTVIEDQTRARQERVDGYRDQHMARLFVDSGWSQEELAAHLAKRWGKEVTQQWVSYHLRFGRFLSFFTTSGCEDEAPGARFNLPPNLTERAFRRLWDATEAGGNYSGHKANTEAARTDERRRFGEVVEALKEAGLSRKKKPVQKAIVAKIGGRSEWLTADQIAERIADAMGGSVPAADVVRSLRTFTTEPDKPYRVEKSGEGPSARYRLVKVKGTVVSRKQVAGWSHDLVPMLDRLIREAQKPRVEISLSALCELASKIKKVMEGVTAEVPPSE